MSSEPQGLQTSNQHLWTHEHMALYKFNYYASHEAIMLSDVCLSDVCLSSLLYYYYRDGVRWVMTCAVCGDLRCSVKGYSITFSSDTCLHRTQLQKVAATPKLTGRLSIPLLTFHGQRSRSPGRLMPWPKFSRIFETTCRGGGHIVAIALQATLLV